MATLEGGKAVEEILNRWKEGADALERRDASLGEVIARIGPPSPHLSTDPYQSLSRAILGQQLAPKAAQAIDRRFREAGGGDSRWVARATVEALRSCGISQRKAESLKALAQEFETAGFGPFLLTGPAQEVESRLTAIRGIGQWTFHMFLIFCRGETNVLPTGDYGVRRGVQKLRGLSQLPKPKELASFVSEWNGWESVGSWYLWKAIDKKLI